MTIFEDKRSCHQWREWTASDMSVHSFREVLFLYTSKREIVKLTYLIVGFAEVSSLN